MKTIFIVNPKAGQGKKSVALIDSIQSCLAETGADGMIYITKGVDDARDFVASYCKENGPARFIACGGDGTLNEVLNGAMTCQDSEVGVIPVGTGNDFRRNFDASCHFHSIKNQIFGKTEACDAIQYIAERDGIKSEGYCINMVNIGFDAIVADMTSEMKKKPFISGHMAYFLSIFVCLVQKKGADLAIKLDGEECYNGKLLLSSLANGSFCGGGMKSNPLASVTDGVLNLNIIKDITRLQLFPLLPHYMDGTILEVKNVDRYLINKDCKCLKVTSNTDKVKISIDGEINEVDSVTFNVVHKAFNFVLPTGENNK